MIKTMYENPVKTGIFILLIGSVAEGITQAITGNGYESKSKPKSKKPGSKSKKRS